MTYEPSCIVIEEMHGSGRSRRQLVEMLHGGTVERFPIASTIKKTNLSLSQPRQFDGWGQTLWILGEHYRFTHDQEFAELVFPRMMHALDWFEKATAADPLHIMTGRGLGQYFAGALARAVSVRLYRSRHIARSIVHF